MNSFSIGIIGGGIIGSSIAYELSQSGFTKIAVFEKNSSLISINQSTRNGGVIHSGLYYPYDVEPLKALLCVEGSARMYEFCSKNKVPYKKTGKLVVAVNKQQDDYLDFFNAIGKENGVLGLERITAREAKTKEPHLGAITSALFVPSTGSVALVPLLETIQNRAKEQGVAFLVNAQVTGVTATANSTELRVTTKTGTQKVVVDLLINAAGLYADEVARMINPASTYKIAPARGELFEYSQMKRKDIHLQGMHVYAAPFCYYNDSKEIADVPLSQIKTLLKKGLVTKTLGVHLSPAFSKIGGQYECGSTVAVGPLKTLGVGKEDYEGNMKTASDYIGKVHSFFPSLKAEDLRPRYTGIMAVLSGHTDFVIERDAKFPQCIQLVGMDSPAWTACFAIARYVRKLLA